MENYRCVDTPVAIADDGEIETVAVSYPSLIGGQSARFFRVMVMQQ